MLGVNTSVGAGDDGTGSIGAVTVSPALAERVRAPLTPVTLMVKSPVGVELPVDTVRVATAIPPLGTQTLDGREKLEQLGIPEALSETCSEKPLIDRTVTV